MIVSVVWSVGCHLLVRVLETARRLELAINALSSRPSLVRPVQKELLVNVPKAECSSISLAAIINVALLLGPL